MIASTPGICRRYSISSAADALGIAQQKAAGALPILRDGAQDLLLQLRAHARQHAQLLLLAEALQFVDGADVEVLEDQRDALGPEPLDLEELERGRRKFRQQHVAPLAGAALQRSPPDNAASPLPIPGMSVTLRSGSRRISAMRSG